jgi:hypothetical protein
VVCELIWAFKWEKEKKKTHLTKKRKWKLDWNFTVTPDDDGMICYILWVSQLFLWYLT